jgi:hypothetical protein
VLIGVFEGRPQADRFVNELRRAGFRNDQIGVMTQHEAPHADQAEEGAVAGALTGGTLGAVAGALATGVVPGLGPVIAAGTLAAALGGAAAGATAGGLVGALIGMGVPEEEAHYYDGELRSGRTLVVVNGDERLAEAVLILRRFKQAS